MALEKLAIVAIKAARILPRGQTFLARSLAKLFPSLREWPIETRYGRMVCDLDEAVCHPLFVFGEYPHWRGEEADISGLPITGDSVVLDIGANIGAMTLLFARKAKHVHSFEPSPRALRLLRKNVPTNCTVHAVALGESNGTATLSETESTDVSFISSEGISVPMQTVDSLGFDPDFIKIDVEGYEVPVLKGARKALKRGVPFMFEALDQSAFDACRETILEANADYRFKALAGGLNHLATTPQPPSPPRS